MTETGAKIYFPQMKEKVINISKYKLDQAENELRMKLVEFSERPEIQSQMGEAFYIWKDDPDFIPDEVTEDQIDDLTFEKFFDWFLYDFRLLDTGERLIEKFYHEERGGLGEEEESILRGWADSPYSFFEVGNVVPGEYCDIRDLFLNREFRVMDASSSKQLRTSDIIGARPMSAGGNVYFSGIISAYPAAFKNIILEFFESEYRLYRKSGGEAADKKEFLRDLGFQISNYTDDLARNPHFITPEGEDLVLASAVYGISNRDEVLGRLEGIESLTILTRPEDDITIFSLERSGENEISGAVEVEEDRIIIQTYSLMMLERAKSLIERELGGLIRHLEDTTKGMESYKDGKKENTRLNRLPPGTKSRKELDRSLEEYYARWIDLPLPALKGLTPREAAKTAEGRNKLGIVLDELENFYEHARMRGEPYFDMSGVRRELKLK